jgi:hypothetical protein
MIPVLVFLLVFLTPVATTDTKVSIDTFVQ